MRTPVFGAGRPFNDFGLGFYCAEYPEYAAEWAPVADEEWAHEKHKKPSYQNYTPEKIEHPELAAFETVVVLEPEKEAVNA